MKRGISILLVVLSPFLRGEIPLPAGRIVAADPASGKITVMHDGQRPFKKNSGVCITRGKRPISLGTITEVTSYQVKIQVSPKTPVTRAQLHSSSGLPVPLSDAAGSEISLSTSAPSPGSNDSPRVGDEVWRREDYGAFTSRREPASASAPSTSFWVRPPSDRWLVEVAGATGFNYGFPLVRVQMPASKYSAVGVDIYFLSRSSEGRSQSIAGGWLSWILYARPVNVRGFFLKFGLGGNSLSIEAPEANQHGTCFASLGMLGWRWSVFSGLTLDVSLGAQYVVKAAELTLTSYQGGLPLFALGLGYPF